ncbi:hypothetical protein [Actinomadura kijaniata]|uniref:hypothetical protein n=1 Tax=Actinomadura kijaniata TaxID=46161 RepID=UPI0012FA068B|nr:hypothetical protein [Actinomadura kijaniata]
MTTSRKSPLSPVVLVRGWLLIFAAAFAGVLAVDLVLGAGVKITFGTFGLPTLIATIFMVGRILQNK